MKYLVLYRGPTPPPDASHAGWRDWFGEIGDALVDIGSPTANGHTVRADGSMANTATNLTGYSIIEGRDLDAAKALLDDHPILSDEAEYSIEVFEIPKKQ